METERIAKLEAQVEAMKDDVAELKGDVKEIHSRITTGNREIMDKIEQLDDRLDAKMRANAEAATKQHQEIQADIKQDVKKVTDRVDILERWRFMIVGGAIAAGYLIAHFELASKLFGK